MAELEIHHETEHHSDPLGQKIGIMASLLAVLLAVVTIMGHRSHTDGIMHKSASNDQWSYYQATRVKLHTTEMGINMVQLLEGKGGTAEKMLAQYEKDKKKYEDSSEKLHAEAERLDKLAETDEARGMNYDIGEGLLEIGLVLTSLYFISRKTMFPLLGLIAGGAGIVMAVLGLLVV
jgi:hypothetical protein